MHVELVRMVTSDDIGLDGMFCAPKGERPGPGAADAVLQVHGSGGTFYSGVMLDMAERFSNAGYAVASFNTTGNGLVWGQPGKFFGNAYEILDRCRLDLAAGIDWLANKGYRRIAIFGHSMGAVKVVYYQAFVQDPRVAAVISASPVRLSHSYFLQSEGAEEHRTFYNQAMALVEAGQPDALFPATFPMPHLFGAAAYLDKHGPAERYNLLRFANKVQCPFLIIAGSEEVHPRLLHCARDMYDSLPSRGHAKLVVEQGADHGWSEKRGALVSHCLDFLASVKAAPVGAPAND